MTHNPWKFQSSRCLFENPWMRIREDQVIQPTGLPGAYTFIEKTAATGVVAMTENDEVYLVGQFRYPMDEYSWEIVEGGAEPGEEPLHAAKRELEEEAGVTANHWEPLGGEIHLSNCISSERGYLYLARDLRPATKRPDPNEVLEVRLEPLAECLRLVDSGEIRDSLTIIALLRVARKLGL